MWYFGTRVISEQGVVVKEPMYRKHNYCFKKKVRDKRKPITKKYGSCVNCGSLFSSLNPLTFHHLKKKVEGGKNNTGNIILLCHECHKRLHSLERFRVDSWK